MSGYKKRKKTESSNNPKSNYFKSKYGYKVLKNIILYNPKTKIYVNSADLTRERRRQEKEKIRKKQREIKKCWYNLNYEQYKEF